MIRSRRPVSRVGGQTFRRFTLDAITCSPSSHTLSPPHFVTSYSSHQAPHRHRQTERGGVGGDGVVNAALPPLRVHAYTDTAMYTL